MPQRAFFLFLVFMCSSFSFSQSSAFDGVEKWKGLLSPATVKDLGSVYSTDPPARSMGKDHKPSADISPETDFWRKLISAGANQITVNTVEEEDKQGLHIVNLAVSMKVSTGAGPRTRYVTEKQAWQQQAGTWRIVIATHTDLVKMPPALHQNPNLYEKDADARIEIKEAEARAAAGHQRVILVFGANWCYDCHVLDQAFHQADVAPLIEKGFQVVHVDIGDDGKKNADLATRYEVPLNRGVPALAVLDANDKLLYSQKNGEFESARSLDPDDVIAFLNKWKP